MKKSYAVFIDDKKTDIEEARVSKYPFNRHWPGHQRSLEQTEICGFISFDAEEKREIKIVCEFDFKKIFVKPKSLNIVPKINGNIITFDITKPCKAVVEFDDRHGALHLFANPKENNTKFDGETIVFKKGVHNPGRIVLKSNQKIYIEEGAVVYGEIYGEDVSNVEISGRGILDHSKQKSFTADDKFVDPMRPSPIEIRYSENVVIKDIVVRDPFFLAVRPIGCENLYIDNIKIIGCWRYNSDGIDLINCRHGIVKNCFVRSFDDSICLKGFCYQFIDEMTHNGKRYDIMEDITVSDCVVWNDWGKALEVGVDLCAAETRNCKLINCDIIHAAGMAMDVANVDYSYVHDIAFENIRLECSDYEPAPVFQESEEQVYSSESKYYPFLFFVAIYYSEEYSSKGERGRINNITFKDIYVYSAQMPNSKIFGYDEKHKVENIYFENVFLNDKKIDSIENANIYTENYTDNVTFK